MRFSFFGLVWGLWAARTVADVVQAASVAGLRHIFSTTQSPANLVFLDVDNVLLAPCDRVLRYAGEQNHYRAKRLEALMDAFASTNVTVQGVACSKAEYLLSTIVATGLVAPLSPDMPVWVRELIGQPNTTVLALSTSVMGAWGGILDGSALVYARLARFGYVFSSINQSSFLYEPAQDLIKGVLYTHNLGKVRAVVTLLDKLTQPNQHIWLVDDRVSILKALDKGLQDYPGNFTGVHYTALRDQAETLDESIADQQFQTLYDQGIWLSDAQAYAELTSDQATQTTLAVSQRSLRVRA